MAKKIKNNKKPNRLISNQIKPISTMPSKGFAFDVSFEGLYYSVKHKEFTNYFMDQKEFIEKFSELRGFVGKIQNKDFVSDLIQSKGMRHCHIIENEERKLALICIGKSMKKANNNFTSADIENRIKQIFAEEKLYQIGFENSGRYIGTYDETRKLFRVYLNDFHHRLSFDTRRNRINPKQYDYSIM